MSVPQFNHPGLVFQKSDIPLILNRVNGITKQKETLTVVRKAYNTLMSAAPLAYTPKPHATMNIGWGEPTVNQAHVDLTTDGQASYTQALAYAFTNNETYAQNALYIIKAWSTTNTSATGRNMPLEFSWSQPGFASALELLKYTYPKYASEGLPVEGLYYKWLDAVVMPQLTTPITWGVNNWLITMCAARMQIAILRNDHVEFNKMVDAYKVYLPQLILPSGLPQEVHRDLCHTQFTMGSLAYVCALAKNQGVDLYSCNNNLLMKGFEMVASILLGESPPEVKGIVLNLVKWHPAYWDTVYAHYVNDQKLSMPKSAAILSTNRPEWYLWCWGGSTLISYTGLD